MNRKITSLRTAAIAAITLTLAAGSFAADKVQIGQPVPSFTLQDQEGKNVSLSDYAGKIVVLEWTNPGCPYVQRHYREKTMIHLADEFHGKDVAWLAINSTHDADNSTNKDWIDRNSLDYPILNDSTGSVGHAYGAKTTPDLFIIDKTGKLAYDGAIDNDPEGDKSADRINYVEKALTELTSGQPVTIAETKSYGCSVKYAN